jgi:hypothetical protein
MLGVSLLSVIMLSAIIRIIMFVVLRLDVCPYAECHYKFCYAELRHDVCPYGKYPNAGCLFVKCHYAGCLFGKCR